jgi:hypothetical protein
MPNPNAKAANSMANNSRSVPNRGGNRNNNKGRRQQQPRPSARSSNDSIRTHGTIISALSKQTSRMNISNMLSSPYAMARLTCCVPSTIPGIPDGSANKAIRVCLYAIDRLAFSAVTTATLQFNPWMPTCVSLVGGNASTSVNGQVTGLTPGVTAVGMGIAAAYAAVPTTQARPGSTSNAIDIYNATSMRIVSQTHAIRYTGPVNNCAGVIRSFQNDWNLSPVGTITASSASTTAPTGTGICAQIQAQNGTVLAYAPLGTEILSLDGPSSTLAIPGPNSVSCRPEQGMTIRLAHKTGKFESVPVRNIPPVVSWFNSSTTTTLATLSHYYPFNGANQPSVIAYDNDWVSQTVILENVNADASFSVESCICVEFMPSASSAFYPLAVGNPATNMPVIQAVQKAIQQHGTAVPGILNGPR